MSFQFEEPNEFNSKYGIKLNHITEINMIPFVDVCLVLLIVFMVTAPFAVSGVNVQLPKARSKPLSISSESLILSISNMGLFYLGKNQVSENELIIKIKVAMSDRDKSPIFIRADKNVPYEKVMIAMAAAQQAGVERIGMIGENKYAKK